MNVNIRIKDLSDTEARLQNITRFDVQQEDALKEADCPRYYSDYDDCIWHNSIAYAPDNEKTRQVIRKVESCITHPKKDKNEKLEWKGFKDEQAIELYLAKGNTTSKIEAAIIFVEGLGLGATTGSDGMVSYKIRLRRKGTLAETQLLFPKFQSPGPDWNHRDDYFTFGFITLQLCIDKAVVELLTGQNVTQKISLQPFPYPFYYRMNFQEFYLTALPLMIVISFVFMVPSIMRSVVSEKETGIRELLKLNGVSGWVQWLGWMLDSLLVLMISVTCVVVLLFVETGVGSTFQYTDPTIFWLNLMLYVISTTSFCLFISSIFTKPLGARWSNIGVPISESDSLCLGHVILVFLISTFLYMFLTLYLENVLPSKFGLRKPWYFIFQPKTYFKIIEKRKKRRSNEQIGLLERISYSRSDDENGPGFEKEPSYVHAVVDIQNLRKDFGEHKVAVDGMSMKIYDGEIFALLGHNGAGKTTTISMLTGMYAPTGGTAIVNGYDITTELDMARDHLGFCPQHNMLFDKLTVSEHLRFFGQLKGLSASAASRETMTFLRKLQLVHKANALSITLTFGEKRKLSVGIALIGGNQIAILDEPTRLDVVYTETEMKGRQTILLITHSMIEADTLGDRIGIMASGKLHCCGSPLFLKKFYGTGYTLKLSVTENADDHKILPFIQNHIPDASMKFEHSRRSPMMFVKLPTAIATTSTLSDMFTKLFEHKDQLGITKVGLFLTTMDDVFIRVGELTNYVNSSHDVTTKKHTTKMNRVVGLKLAMEHFRALLLKKWIYTYRGWKMVVIGFLFSALFLSLSNLPTWVQENETTPISKPALKMTLDSYKDPITLLSSTDLELSFKFFNVVGSSFNHVPKNATLDQALLDVASSNLGDYREKYIVAFDANASNINALFNTIPNHAAPLAINLASNMLLKTLEPNKTHLLGIFVTSHPMETKENNPNDYGRFHILHIDVTSDILIYIPVLLIVLLTTSFVVFPVEEKICKSKQLQMMTGVSPLTYWYSSFLLDFLFVFLIVLVMTICFPILLSSQIYENEAAYEGAGVFFLILLVYGFAAVPFSYLISLYPTTASGGFLLVFTIHFISGIILHMALFILEQLYPTDLWVSGIKLIGQLFPTFGVVLSTFTLVKVMSENTRCNILKDDINYLHCDPANAPEYNAECCKNCEQIMGVTCFTPEPYMSWSRESNLLRERSRIQPGIGQEVFIMVMMGLVYQVILMLLEYRVFKRFFVKKNLNFEDNVTDDDVRGEAERVAALVKNEKVNEDALVVENLSKRFGTFDAVSKLNFGVHHGECFGLVGVAGAGKSTTFRILTGDETMTFGNAHAFTKTLEKDGQEFVSNIGYCPQFDGIIGVLTGREMLQLYGRLRGVPAEVVGTEADKWLQRVGLSDSANQQCKTYSGGMKRRLSVSMALIGDPALLILDAPTSGVDPVARRRLWDLLRSLQDSGQSIILTSQSMEECEALCSRLGILINGKLECLGSVQHLKHKFAQGYSLSLKLKPFVP
ncbi:ATP-binding cassette sub-family A member 3 [Orchesella cincta]|uniref:ATP-binding cassette sub-family A member 3 n=1 Tax=Orchesella cincta TaxID=48709 RepID=A0A1D2MC68_ORCCI|nr:ATP-binding cassette sub-family A member 3 [Orchesella cincta]